MFAQTKRDAADSQYEIDSMKEVHSKEKEELIGELMALKKSLENAERKLIVIGEDNQRHVGEHENIQKVNLELSLEMKKLRNELNFVSQAEKLATSKLDKYTKEFSEMKANHELQKEEHQRLLLVERSKNDEIRKNEV